MRITASIDVFALDARLVERPALGAAPTAFRIWAAGSNPTDKGPTLFTPRSAEVLIAAQAARGNLCSIDVDHLSLSEVAPPEARKAVGWHRLEVRVDEAGAPELWATAVQWTDVAKAGLEKEPPEWRYFSPAYDVDPKTGEVVAYLNTALTNNPATWNVTALATRGASTGASRMTKSEIVAALKHMAKGEEVDGKSIASALLAMMGDGEGGEKKPEEKKDAEPGDKEPDGDEKKEASADGDGDEKKPDEKKDSARVAASNVDFTLAARLQELERKLAAKEEAEERTRLLASRADFAPEVRSFVEKLPLADLRRAVKELPPGPAGKADPKDAAKRMAASASVQATRGEGQKDVEESSLAPDEKKRLDERMGLRRRQDAVQRQGRHMTFAAMDRETARRALAQKGGER